MALAGRFALGFAVLAGAAAVRAAEKDRTPRFESDILPVLSARCLKCHGGARPKAGLDLRTRAGILQGGESGPALVPGSADRSLLFGMIQKGEMPPAKSPRLTAEQVALIKAWIERGALAADVTRTETGPKIGEKDRKFWAFQKPVRPPVPRVRHTERIRTPIDAFILARL